MSALDPPIFARIFAELERCKAAGIGSERAINTACDACGRSALAHGEVSCLIPEHCHSRTFCCCCDCAGYQPAPNSTPKENLVNPTLEALTKLLSSGVALAPEVITFINAVRQQHGMTDAEIIAHARGTNDANNAKVVARQLQVMNEIAAQEEVNNAPA